MSLKKKQKTQCTILLNIGLFSNLMWFFSEIAQNVKMTSSNDKFSFLSYVRAMVIYTNLIINVQFPSLPNVNCTV